MRITFGDLRIGDTARRYMAQAMDRCWVSEGENVREFERLFSRKFGYGNALATSSGTDACACACASLYDSGRYTDVRRGDEIIVPALTFAATINAVLMAGFTPVFVDIDIESLNMDPGKIERAITNRTRAIMPVHLMGKPASMDMISGIARAYGLSVIEDCCEAHGAVYDGRVVGSIGDLGVFSFYVAHMIVCGEGGMVVTGSDETAKVVCSVRSHGRPAGNPYFDFQRTGWNSKMNDMEAAIGLEGLEYYDETFAMRRENLKRLLSLTTPLGEYCRFIKEEPHELISPHAFPLVLRDEKLRRDSLYSYLEECGIQCKTLFGSLPTQHRAFKFLGYRDGDFPVAEYVGNNGLHFGIHQYLSDHDIEYCAERLDDYFGRVV